MKVKVNRVRGGSMGDQRNYGLVTGSIWNYEDKPSTNEVSDTLGPVDRDQATIEAERGETVIYPDKDGQITHAKIGGKRHVKGGTPLDIPDGAFVYSDTRALLIKNKELLKNIFGMNGKKAVTPAKIAKRYDLNQYNEILNDPLADPLEKRTAQLMLDNNMKKLGQLALVQEGMKGFPDGIPDIALPLFGSDLAVASPGQQMPQAKFGGQIMRRGGRILPMHQSTGTTGEKRKQYTAQDLQAGSVIYINGQPVKLGETGDIGFGNDYVKFDKAIDLNPADHTDGYLVTRMRVQDILSGLNQGYLPMDWGAGFSGSGQDFVNIGSFNMPDVNWWGRADDYSMVGFGATPEESLSERNTQLSTLPKTGYTFKIGNKTYKVINPNVYDDKEQYIQAEEVSDPDFWGGWSGTWEGGPKLIPLSEFKTDYMTQTQSALPQAPKAGTSTENKTAAQIAEEKKIAEANIASGKWWNQHKPHILDYIARVKNGSISVNQVPTEYLKYLKKEGIDISKATSTQNTNTNTQNTPRKDNAGTNAGNAPKTTKQYISDDEILKHYQELGIPMTKDKITDDIRIRLSGMAKGGSIIMFDPVENKVLPRMQKGNQFNIYDKNYRDWLAQNKLKIVTPSWWNESYTSIGNQLPGSSSNYSLSNEGIILPKSGISGFSGIDNLIEYHEKNGIDFSTYGNAKDTAEGKKKFKEDIAKSSAGDWGTHEKATSWLLDAGEEENKKRAKKAGIDITNMPSQINKNQAGWNRVGTDIITGFKYLEPETSPPPPPPTKTPNPKYKCVDGKVVVSTDGTGYDTEAEAGKNCAPPGEVPNPKYTSGYPGGWTDYSKVNLGTAMGMAGLTEPGALPAFTQVFPDLGRPVYLDPTTNIMNQLALVNQQNEQIAGMSAPTQGRANIIAGQAAAAPNIAQTRAEYDKANAQIANTYEGQRAAILNDAEYKNAGFRKQFQDELATRRQQYINALRGDMANVAYQYERGSKDFREKNALNVQNPNYMFDDYGNIMFKPGYNPNANASSNVADMIDGYIEKGMDPNKAAALVAAQLKLNDNAFNYDPMSAVWGTQKTS